MTPLKARSHTPAALTMFSTIDLSPENRSYRVTARTLTVLEGPGCGRMGSHVEVNNSAGSMFHDHQHVKDSKSGARYKRRSHRR